MKAKNSLLKTFFCALLCMLIFVGAFLFVPQKSASAEVFNTVQIGDDNFSMSLGVNSRNNSALPLKTMTVETDAGTINYYVFEWKDLEDLQFRFQSDIENSTKTFTQYEFLVSHRAHENDEQTVETLYHGNIANNNFSSFEFYYYIDSNFNITESATRCKGNDFGYYKFDFNYTYTEDNEAHTISIGEFYIAVLPQDVNSVPETNVKLLYTVTSSNKLMNVFNIYLSNDSYKYVDPANLQWNVVGTDKMNFNYVLSKVIQEKNLSEYANYRVLYENLKDPIGTNFIFDSNDIEGTWTAILTIKSDNGNDKVLQVSGLSTIKQQQTSYLWLIFLIIGIIILIASIILLIVLRKKRDKVW